MVDRTDIRKLVMIFISLYAGVMIIMTKSFHSFVYLTHSGLDRELSVARFLSMQRMGGLPPRSYWPNHGHLLPLPLFLRAFRMDCLHACKKEIAPFGFKEGSWSRKLYSFGLSRGTFDLSMCS